ncbi:flavoprotein [Viridibacillus sp. NPDC093762]|uniref:flavoprotein n=1 Tax=Viridibacillus sp. NPDC093762 TaxID=3390720 RepID=UPI003D094F53
MPQTFRQFLDSYLEIWRTSSFEEMKALISIDYQAREITQNGILDYGYCESLEGWTQGFNFVKNKEAKWDIREIGIVSLGKDECMAILSGTILLDGQSPLPANLFFETFRFENNGWKQVRSYTETGVPVEHLNGLSINRTSVMTE